MDGEGCPVAVFPINLEEASAGFRLMALGANGPNPRATHLSISVGLVHCWCIFFFIDRWQRFLQRLELVRSRRNFGQEVVVAIVLCA